HDRVQHILGLGMLGDDTVKRLRQVLRRRLLRSLLALSLPGKIATVVGFAIAALLQLGRALVGLLLRLQCLLLRGFGFPRYGPRLIDKLTHVFCDNLPALWPRPWPLAPAWPCLRARLAGSAPGAT